MSRDLNRKLFGQVDLTKNRSINRLLGQADLNKNRAVNRLLFNRSTMEEQQKATLRNAGANTTNYSDKATKTKFSDFYTVPEVQGNPPLKGSFKEKLVQNALNEYNAWSKGKIKEGDEKTLGRLIRYWGTVAKGKEIDRVKDGSAWSAAFISTMVKEAGYDNFKFSGRHSDYLVKAKENREKNSGGYKGYKIDEVKVEVGDLVAYPDRNSNPDVTYETTGNYASHSDIVVEVHDDYIVTVGGNVSNSVSRTKVPIKDGKIANDKYHMVVKFN